MFLLVINSLLGQLPSLYFAAISTMLRSDNNGQAERRESRPYYTGATHEKKVDAARILADWGCQYVAPDILEKLRNFYTGTRGGQSQTPLSLLSATSW